MDNRMMARAHAITKRQASKVRTGRKTMAAAQAWCLEHPSRFDNPPLAYFVRSWDRPCLGKTRRRREGAGRTAR